MAHRLTPEQVAFFQANGYLNFHQPVFTPERFRQLQEHFEGLLTRWQTWNQRSPEHMDVPHFADPGLFRWLLADEALDIVEPLIGPDIALWSSHFICKPPRVGKRVPWHEDSAYWKGRLDPMEVVTLWLALDPSTPANGCMRVIPGSHHDGYSDYAAVADPQNQVFGTEIKPGKFDEHQAVDMVLQPNQCSIHHGRLIHGSNANHGTMRRCGYTMRYIPTTVKFLPAQGNDAFQIYLARGRDRAGNRYGDPGTVNRAWLDRYPEGWPAGH